jgi:hypothetical protein
VAEDLAGYSRIYHETPSEVVLRFDWKDGYRVEGTQAVARSKDRLAVTKTLLPRTPPGFVIEDLLNRWPSNGIPRPGSKTLSSDLESAIKEGRVLKTGEGRRAILVGTIGQPSLQNPLWSSSVHPYRMSREKANTRHQWQGGLR